MNRIILVGISILLLSGMVTSCSSTKKLDSVENVDKLAACLAGAITAYGNGAQKYEKDGCKIATYFLGEGDRDSAEPRVSISAIMESGKKSVKLVVKIPAAQLKANEIGPVVAKINTFTKDYNTTMQARNKNAANVSGNPLDKNVELPCRIPHSRNLIDNTWLQFGTVCDAAPGVDLFLTVPAQSNN